MILDLYVFLTITTVLTFFAGAGFNIKWISMACLLISLSLGILVAWFSYDITHYGYGVREISTSLFMLATSLISLLVIIAKSTNSWRVMT